MRWNLFAVFQSNGKCNVGMCRSHSCKSRLATSPDSDSFSFWLAAQTMVPMSCRRSLRTEWYGSPSNSFCYGDCCVVGVLCFGGFLFCWFCVCFGLVWVGVFSINQITAFWWWISFWSTYSILLTWTDLIHGWSHGLHVFRFVHGLPVSSRSAVARELKKTFCYGDLRGWPVFVWLCLFWLLVVLCCCCWLVLSVHGPWSRVAVFRPVEWLGTSSCWFFGVVLVSVLKETMWLPRFTELWLAVPPDSASKVASDQKGIEKTCFVWTKNETWI